MKYTTSLKRFSLTCLLQYVPFTVCPSPPVTPEAYDKTKDSVSLRWQMPRHDGRGRIFGYLVEYQKPGAVEWIPANESPEQCPDLHYVVTGLSDGQEYVFRIFTVNAAGKSDPAYVKQSVKVHDRLGKKKLYHKHSDCCYLRLHGTVGPCLINLPSLLHHVTLLSIFSTF